MDWMDIMDEMDEVDKHRRTRTCTDRDIRIMRSRGIMGGMRGVEQILPAVCCRPAEGGALESGNGQRVDP